MSAREHGWYKRRSATTIAASSPTVRPYNLPGYLYFTIIRPSSLILRAQFSVTFTCVYTQ